jgi:hypothetical protein
MEIYRKRLIAYSLGNFAGYKVFALGGLSSTSMVLQTTLNPDGTFAGGRIRPTLLVGAGVPARGGDRCRPAALLAGLRCLRAAHRRERRIGHDPS